MWVGDKSEQNLRCISDFIQAQDGGGEDKEGSEEAQVWVIQI